MINCYIKKQHRLTVVEGVEYLNNIEDRKSVIWIDMFTPTLQEVKTVENIFSIEFPTKQESEEIELSSRYWEEGNRIEINSYFLINDKKVPVNETVSFILQDDLLISVRYKKLASFDASIKKLLSSPREYRTGYSIFSQIIDIRIDADADRGKPPIASSTSPGQTTPVPADPVHIRVQKAFRHRAFCNMTSTESLFLYASQQLHY